jgi:hypothetical protein
VFTGSALNPADPGHYEAAVAVSTGPFLAGVKVSGHLTPFPDVTTELTVSCGSPSLCVLTAGSSLYATSAPLTGEWHLQITVTGQSSLGGVSCPTAVFCVASTGSGVLVSTDPTGGQAAWKAVPFPSQDGGMDAVDCPTAQECIGGGGSYTDNVGGWLEWTRDPFGSWEGAQPAHPPFAQHSGQYFIDGISCPTVAFCVAHVAVGQPLVSTNPAGGLSTWQPINLDRNLWGTAWCDSSGTCNLSGAGSFQSTPGAAGPGVAGYPEYTVSCATTSLCVSTGGPPPFQLQVSAVTATPQQFPL